MNQYGVNCISNFVLSWLFSLRLFVNIFQGRYFSKCVLCHEFLMSLIYFSELIKQVKIWMCKWICKIAYVLSWVQSLSRVRLFVTPWIAARQASLSITNSWSLPRLTSIESVMPSSHLILWRPLLLLPPIPPSIRVFTNESTLRMRWPKYWSFSFSIIPSKEIPGLIFFCCVQIFVTLWTVACQAPLSMGCSRQEYWSRLPFPSPGDLRNPGTEPTSLMSPTLADGFFTTGAT